MNFDSKSLGVLSFIVTLIHCQTGMKVAFAQADPTFPDPSTPQIPTFPELPSLPDDLKVPTPSSPPLLPPEERPNNFPPDQTSTSFVVREFKIIGSTVFTPKTFQTITDAYLNRLIQFSDLLELRSKITNLYVQNGYVTSGALLPEAPILQQGVVTIRILEGRLERIEIRGNKRLNPSYIRKRVALGVKTPLNTNQLLKALRKLQINPLIQTISTELAASERPGFNILRVNISEADTRDLTLSLNNSRPTNIGSFQRMIEFEERNLTGNGDVARVLFANTDGSNEVEASYQMPINARDGTLELSFRQVWSRVIAEPFDQLDLIGRSRSLNLRYRQPILASPTQELALGIQLGRRESETELLGIPFPISPGADFDGQTEISGLNFFQEWFTRNRRSVLALRSDFGVGLDIFATDNPTPPDGEFFLWRGQAQYIRQLAPATLLQFRSNLQFADRRLVSIEQFGLGGPQTVRGYPQNLRLVDDGVTASLEVSVPLFQTRNRQGLLQIFPFVDYGQGFNSGNRPNGDSNSLVAVGLGLGWRWSDRIRARINWGIPLTSTATVNRGIGDSQIFFTIDAKLF